MKKFFFLGLLMKCLLFSYAAHASHLSATTLDYRCLGNHQYEVTSSLYTYCDGLRVGTFPLNVQLNALNSCSSPPTPVNFPIAHSETKVVPISCYTLPDKGDRCDTLGFNSSFYYLKTTFLDTITIPVAFQSCGFRLSFSSCCRSGSVTSMVNPNGTAIHVEVEIHDPNSCNNSPVIGDVPVDYAWAGIPRSIAHVAHDADGDSLVYSIEAGQQSHGVPAQWAAGYSNTRPLWEEPNTTIGFDPITGTWTFTPIENTWQVTEFDILIQEYRNGQLIATSRKQYYLIVLQPQQTTVTPPQLQQVRRWNGSVWQPQGTSTVFDYCPGELLSFQMEFVDPALSDTLYVDSLYTNLQEIYPTAVVQQFQPSSNRLILQVDLFVIREDGFQLSIMDNQCPFAGLQSYGIGFRRREACGRIWGFAFKDTSNNCTLDPQEERLGNALVTLRKGNVVQTTTSLANGFYNFMVQDTGSYQLAVQSGAANASLCSSAQTVVHATTDAVLQHDLPTTLALCTQLEVSIGSPALTPCTNNQYVVQYCNQGTQEATNAYIEVTLDPLFVVDSSSLPLVSQIGNLYTYTLGTVGANTCEQFTIYGRLDTACTTVVGRTFCAQAHIFPTTTCAPWTGSQLLVEGVCQQDSVGFRVHNVGQQAMPTPTSYRIFQDNSLYFTSSPISLAAGASSPWRYFPATGATYQLHIDQEAAYPWGLYASAAVEGCLDSTTTNTPSLGFVTPFSMDDGAPFVSIDCQASASAPATTAKLAFPEGYGSAHYIRANERLRYRLVFQNMGTGTAQKLVLVDTLSPFLDGATVRPMASSHAYSWRLRESRILEVTFDSITMPMGGVGFLEVEVQQQPNVALGSVVYNTAALYWDNQLPVYTNTTFHTIDENFWLFTSTAPTARATAPHITVFPNPFEQSTTLRVEHSQQYQQLRVQIYNALGQLVQQTQNQQGEQNILVQRKNWPQGIYFYRLEGDGQLLHTGQLIAQ